MANGEADYSAANDIVELEALRKDGFSWHPCKVSLCSRGRGLIVLYGNNLEEMITVKQEIFARIRVRSTPLQGDDCSSIRQGEQVLATETSRVEGVFYDARVEKAIHVRHSKRIHCRCSFTIKWLHHALPEEALTVPASAIMKLATKSIHLHPTISAFFSMHEPSNSLDTTPCSETAEGMNWEMDINLLLEQQIKEISTSTDVPQENILKGYVSGHKVDLQGQSHGWKIEASSKDPLGTISFLDKLNGFNGSENKQSVEMISETTPAPTPTPSIQEELRGNRFLLNPLAARAALASLRSEFPQTPEFSAQSNEKRDTNGLHSIANLPQRSKFCSFSAVDCSSNVEDFSLKISATLEGKSPNLRSIVKKLFPTSSPSHIVEISNLSSGSEINGTAKKNEMGEKKTMLSAEMRLTRSQIQKDDGMHGTSQMTNNNETQSRLTETRRVTRSRVKGAEKIEAKNYNEAGRDHVRNEFTKLEPFPHRAIAPQNCLSDNLKSVASPINGQINSQRVTRSRVKGVEKTEANKYNAAVKDIVPSGSTKPGTSTQDSVAPLSDNPTAVASPTDGEAGIHSVQHEKDVLGKDGMIGDVDTRKGYLIQDAGKHNNSKRLTRSAASEDTENNIVQLKLKQRKNNSIESKNNEQLVEEGGSEKILPQVNTTPKSSESSVGGARQKKCASSKKQETRFSPRLRFLPRTRSQSKA